jgi:hypothetical protein
MFHDTPPCWYHSSSLKLELDIIMLNDVRMDDSQMPVGAALHAATAIQFLSSAAELLQKKRVKRDELWWHLLLCWECVMYGIEVTFGNSMVQPRSFTEVNKDCIKLVLFLHILSVIWCCLLTVCSLPWHVLHLPEWHPKLSQGMHIDLGFFLSIRNHP